MPMADWGFMIFFYEVMIRNKPSMKRDATSRGFFTVYFHQIFWKQERSLSIDLLIYHGYAK